MLTGQWLPEFEPLVWDRACQPLETKNVAPAWVLAEYVVSAWGVDTHDGKESFFIWFMGLGCWGTKEGKLGEPRPKAYSEQACQENRP